MQSVRPFIRTNIKQCRRTFSACCVLKQSSQPQTQPQKGPSTELLRTSPAPIVDTSLQVPQSEAETKKYSPKVENLVNEITKLNLIEVGELSDLLKKKLNLPDTPLMPMGAISLASAAPAAEEEEEAPKKVQTNFTVKLLKFDEKQKVALIKEVKNLLEGMNLVQAKKFVESAPTVVKADMPKEDAEKLKEALCKVGAECVIE